MQNKIICKASAWQPGHLVAETRAALRSLESRRRMPLPKVEPKALEEVFLEDPTNFDLQRGVAPRAGRQPGGIGPLGDIGPIGRRGDRQYLADRLDPMDPTMIVDKGDYGLNRQSSSAWAK